MRGTWQTTGGGGSGGGGLVLAVIAAAVLIGSGTAIASALVTVAIIIASIIGLAVAGVIGLLVYRARSEGRRRPVAAPVVYQLPPEVRPQLEESHNRAIEPPRELHIHVHVADATQAAAIIRQAIPGPAGDVITEGK